MHCALEGDTVSKFQGLCYKYPLKDSLGQRAVCAFVCKVCRKAGHMENCLITNMWRFPLGMGFQMRETNPRNPMIVGTKGCVLYTIDASHTLSPWIIVIRDLAVLNVRIVKGCGRQNSKMIANDPHLCIVFSHWVWVGPLNMISMIWCYVAKGIIGVGHVIIRCFFWKHWVFSDHRGRRQREVFSLAWKKPNTHAVSSPKGLCGMEQWLGAESSSWPTASKQQGPPSESRKKLNSAITT